MKCILPGANAKVFSKAINSLAKIGSELYIEANSDFLSIRTINLDKSAFAVFKFFPNFFTNYSLDESAELNRCKVSLKVCIAKLRNMKNVELCKLFINSDDSKLVIQFKCRKDTLKTNFISIIDADTLQAAYRKGNVPNKILGTHKIFSEISNNFQLNEEEITFEADPNKLVIKNYIEGTKIDRRFMRSQLTIKSDEFEKYSIDEETSVTFCLKEFRAILNFAESLNLSMLVNFETAGRPIVFILENLQVLEVNLVMSTLSPEDLTMYSDNNNSFQSTTSTHASTQINNLKKRNDTDKIEKNAKKARIENNSNVQDDMNELFNFKRNNDTEPNSIEPARGNSNIEFEEEQIIQLSPPKHSEENIDSNVNKILNSNTKENVNLITRKISNINAIFNEENKESDEVFITFKDTEEQQQNINEDQINNIPASPTSTFKKKKRVVFQRCFEATLDTAKRYSLNNEILARNSDTED